MSVFSEFRAANEANLKFAYLNFRQPVAPRGRSQGDYCVSEYAAKLLCSVLHYSGFERKEQIEEAVLIVGAMLEPDTELHLNPGQRTNHYLKTFSIGSKEGYHLAMASLAKRLEGNPSFYPETYLLPNERDQLRDAIESSPVWIQKPAGGARGGGIKLLKDFPRVPPTRRVVVQKYVANPLLIKGRKFDLRFYVAVTSLDPLRIYMYDNGIVRIATQPYEENVANLDVLTAHLTNMSINKDAEGFRQTEKIEADGTGNKWSHRPFWTWLETQGFDVDAIRGKIEDAIVQIVLAARTTLLEQPNHRNAFELFGFDIMIDAEQNVYVLEGNVSPALGTASAIDQTIKTPLVVDFFNLALVPKRGEVMRKVDALMMATGGSQKAKDFIAAWEFEVAETRLGGFKRLFPTIERATIFEKLLTPASDANTGLIAYLNMSDEEKDAFLASGLDAWKEFLTLPPPAPPVIEQPIPPPEPTPPPEPIPPPESIPPPEPEQQVTPEKPPESDPVLPAEE
jgi:hypothetical protein